MNNTLTLPYSIGQEVLPELNNIVYSHMLSHIKGILLGTGYSVTDICQWNIRFSHMLSHIKGIVLAIVLLIYVNVISYFHYVAPYRILLAIVLLICQYM